MSKFRRNRHNRKRSGGKCNKGRTRTQGMVYAARYSILRCIEVFAGKSVPVITLMNGNKSRESLALSDIMFFARRSPFVVPSCLGLSPSPRYIHFHPFHSFYLLFTPSPRFPLPKVLRLFP